MPTFLDIVYLLKLARQQTQKCNSRLLRHNVWPTWIVGVHLPEDDTHVVQVSIRLLDVVVVIVVVIAVTGADVVSVTFRVGRSEDEDDENGDRKHNGGGNDGNEHLLQREDKNHLKQLKRI